ncbi:cyclase family protein [Roseovarius sp. CAU 1744]|uniref:cyclase family protein n=1 Tax=Roseovarius sp. CAU 1744 TaxID=3140368 RepID=UPI00325B956D
MKISRSKRSSVFATIFAMSMGFAAQHTLADAGAQSSPWGPHDEIGSLNAMTDQSRLDVLSAVTTGRAYDLGVELFVGMPDCCSAAFGDPTFQIMMTHTPSRADGSELLSHSSEAIIMNTHTGTHMDTLSHFGLHGEIWNGVSAKDSLGDRGWHKSGAENYPPIIARGVLIDVVGSKGTEQLPASYTISVADVRTALEQQQTELLPGDVVLIRTGQMTKWPAQEGRSLFKEPGVGLEAAKWLVEEKGAMLLGADNFGLESFPSADPQNFAPVHSYLLAEKGIPFFELLWLEDLARDKVYEFLFVGAPIKLRGASGAPVRPLAIPIAAK